MIEKIINCEVCGLFIIDTSNPKTRKYCSECKRKRKLAYRKKNYVQFLFLKKNVNVFTNGVTEEIKPLIPKIKNDVLNDAIKNPRKYLKNA